MEMNDFVILSSVAVAIIYIIIELCSCRRYVITCDEGAFVCTKRFMGGEVIHKHHDNYWWIWPDDRWPNGIIRAHNPRLILSRNKEAK